MSRAPFRPRPLFLAGAAVVLAALAALAWVLAAEGKGGEIPVYRVARGPFRLEVPTEGTLVAVESVQVPVPQDAPTPARLAWIVPDGTAVAAGDVILRFDPSDLEKEQKTAATELERTELELEKKRAEWRRTLFDLERDAEAARLESEMAGKFAGRDAEIYSRREIVESAIDTDLASRRFAHAEAAREAQQKLADLEEQLLDLKRQKSLLAVRRNQGGLAALNVTAPFAGIVVLRRGWRGDLPKVGDSVWPGQAIAEIPKLDRMAAEVFVLEADAGGLEPGKLAELVVEAAPERTFNATIETVGKVAQPRIAGSPVQYFTVRLELEATDPAVMRPGLRVRAALALLDLTGVLAVPRQAIFEDDGKTVVFKKDGARFTPVEVELGAAGPGRVVLSKGVAEGDLVALVHPEGRAPSTSNPSPPSLPPKRGGGMRRIIIGGGG